MNCSSFYRSFFRKIYIVSSLAGHHAVEHAMHVLRGIPVTFITGRDDIPSNDLNSHTLFINSPGASIVRRCPGSRGHICCNYLTVDLYEGCPIGCTYCIMKSYLNFSPITVNIQTEEAIGHIKDIARNNPGTTIRIGTGEVGDSLLIDPLFGISRQFIEDLAPCTNVYFELKTKTSWIDHLLDIPEKGNAVIGFSLNPQGIVKKEEGISAPLAARLAAAKKAAENGFFIAFHFDPVFSYDGWMDDYTEVIRKLKDISPKKIVWISLGTFRFTRDLREKIKDRWFLYDEFVPCKDKKYRYIQHVRGEIYKILVHTLKAAVPGVPLYMCMESPVMWRKIFRKNPRKLHQLCAIFKPARL
jgi:spore photoproduct lyase